VLSNVASCFQMRFSRCALRLRSALADASANENAGAKERDESDASRNAERHTAKGEGRSASVA
jgi:hypothetical protein